MTKQLQELFNLTETAEPELQESVKTIMENRELIAEADAAIDRIDEALPLVRSLDMVDSELDDLADSAKKRFDDMMDLALNVDPRFGGPIFQTASNLLGHAISAKQAKIDRKLRTVALQLQKAKLDHQIEKDKKSLLKDEDNESEPIDGKGVVLDRNALIAQMMESIKPNTQP